MARRPLSQLSCPSCRQKIVSLLTPNSSRSYTRPANAPKALIDTKHIRQNPGLYKQNCLDRNYPSQAENSWKILELHNTRQLIQKDALGFRTRNNELRRALAEAASISGDAEGSIARGYEKQALLDEARHLKEQLNRIEAEEKEIDLEIEHLALSLPNLSSNITPVGAEPTVLSYINPDPREAPDAKDRIWRSHTEIGAELDILDFAAAASTSGWGFYYLTNAAALLEQALIQYALALAMQRGWKVVSPPSMVYAHMAAACGFQPRDANGEQQIYGLDQPDKDEKKPKHVLAGTAEIPLASWKAEQTLRAEELPLKVVGVSRCYRAEAGARGVDTKGLYRVHEFSKVEMFAWTMPDSTPEPNSSSNSSSSTYGFFSTDPTESAPTSSSASIFMDMLALQRDYLTSLNLHCRILEQPTHDLGASATRKIDIEAFFPSRPHAAGWGEVTSLSACGDYQSRRLGTRLKAGGTDGGKGKVKGGEPVGFPYTLNGTAVAVPRVLAALLENGWDEGRKEVCVPECLRPWMGGREWIGKE
ncbi:seryl-tRNA synthetase [Aulographum hederae CBS 113979]|uniref:serine--tRNA ligase n=1 Tax=Aulographum hederae CBS 113979 TaxID=1176131 RepID=A0A6G1GK91_9PEZI|nr:seryl-tRNA synthetase [Aulographum hederae CBS 113979]